MGVLNEKRCKICIDLQDPIEKNRLKNVQIMKNFIKNCENVKFTPAFFYNANKELSQLYESHPNLPKKLLGLMFSINKNNRNNDVDMLKEMLRHVNATEDEINEFLDCKKN
jgi:hypothetical protein